MEFLGKVEETIPDGRAIVRGGTLPDVGDRVYNRKEQTIGTVKRIFGPVDSPYVTVQVTSGNSVGLKGEPLYFARGHGNVKNKRRN